MDYVEPDDPRWAELMRQRAQHQAIDAAVALPTWPVYAPRLPHQQCWLTGIGRRNGQLVMIGFAAGQQGERQGLTVTNELLSGGTIASLDRLLADRFAAAGRNYPVRGELPPNTFRILPEAPRARPTVVLINGVPTAGFIQHEAEFAAVRVVRNDVVITSTGRGIDPASVEYVRVSDLTQFRSLRATPDRPAPRASNWKMDSPWHRPPDRSQPLWAHRGLVEMCSAHAEQHRPAIALNRPGRWLHPDWSLWWAAATAQQMELAGQDNDAARRAVTDMVNLVSTLAGGAGWWSRPELRQRAVNQILWFTATGDQSISSASAQQAWLQRADRHHHAALQAWAAWAADQR